MTLDQIESLLKKTPTEIFGNQPDKIFKVLQDIRKHCHPDKFPAGSEDAERADHLFRLVGELFCEATGAPKSVAPVVIKTKKRSYVLGSQLGTGDVSSVFLADGEREPGVVARYVVKISRVVGADVLLKREWDALVAIHKQAGDEHYAKYFPMPIETLRAKSEFAKRVNVYAYDPGFFTLKQIHDRYPLGLDGKHLVWMFKRLLTGLGFAHLCGYVHASVLPENVMFHAASHGCRIVSWIHSLQKDELPSHISAAYRSWYPPEVLGKRPCTPATDIYLAAKCMLYAAGGNLVSGDIPATSKVPHEIQSLIRACLLGSPAKRDQNAWNLLDELSEVAESVYGPPRFCELSMI